MEILVTPVKALNISQKTKLERAGYIVIESDEPDKIKIVPRETNFETTDLLMAALFGLTTKTPVGRQEHFVNNLYERLSKNQP